jgi:uncharacterized HAD superfamily protein
VPGIPITLSAPRAILLAIDSTVYPLLDAMGSLPGGARVSDATITDWDDLPGVCGGVGEMLALFEQAMSYEVLSQLAPSAGCQEVLARWAGADTKIHVATDRAEHFDEITRRYLADNDIVFPTLRCERKLDKLALASELGCDLIIDDHPLLLGAAARAGAAVTCLRWGFNAAVIDEHHIEAYADWTALGASRSTPDPQRSQTSATVARG